MARNIKVRIIVIVQLLEAVDECHCERPQGAKQSLKIASSLSLLAMTRLLPEAELLRIINILMAKLIVCGKIYIYRKGGEKNGRLD